MGMAGNSITQFFCGQTPVVKQVYSMQQCTLLFCSACFGEFSVLACGELAMLACSEFSCTDRDCTLYITPVGSPDVCIMGPTSMLAIVGKLHVQ